MEPISFIIISGIVVGISVFASFQNKKRKIKKKMRNAPFKRIEHVTDGETVTIAGNVVFYKRSIKAPLSSRECVYYHVTVERLKSSGKSSKWVKEIDEASAVNFLIDDGEQLALVEANAIEGFLEMDRKYKSGSFNDASQALESFLQKYNIKSTTTFGFNKKMRYKEGALEKHEYCIICGTCYWEKAKDYEIDGPEDILIIKATKEQPVYITDVKDILIK
ncbi:MAG: hypothetical protein R2730_10375 [Chitinophagales bacterium]